MSGNVLFPVRPLLHRCTVTLIIFLFDAACCLSPVWASPASQKTNQPKVIHSSALATELQSLKIQPVESVTVISSRLPGYQEDIEEISSNVTYKSRDDLKETQSLTLQDALQDTEGATFFDSVGNGWDSSIGLRGFSDTSNIAFLLDGVRVNETDGNTMNFPLLAMNDMESIQINRGSASPIYGNNAFAGAVNMTSGQPGTKPLKLFGGSEWDSFRGLRFHQGFSGTLQDKVTPLAGKFTYYFKGGRNAGNGWRASSEFRITDFDIKTAYELPENQGRVYFGIKHIVDSVKAPGEMTFQQYQDDARRNNKPLDERRLQNTIAQIGVDKKFWDNHLTASLLASWRPDRSLFYTTSGTFTDFTFGFNPNTSLVVTHSRDQDLTWQLQYEDAWENVTNHTQFGMEIRNQREEDKRLYAFRGNVAPQYPLQTDRFTRASNTGIFWRETLKFFDKIIPYFGMRHDFQWLSTVDHLDMTQDLSRRWQKSTLSTGVTVKPVFFTDLFFDYSQGFRVPSISDINPFNGTISSNLVPEQSSSYETGLRLRMKKLAQYKASFFLIDLKDEIAFDSQVIGPSAPFGQNINIGKSRRYGIEQRVDLKPVKEMKLYGSYTWMEAYVRETTSSNSPVDGRSLGQIPENRFTLGSILTPLARFRSPYNGFKMSLRGVFTGRQHPQSYESASQSTLNATGGAGHFIKGYSVWDFILSYEWHAKMIYFKINNVFDEKYYSRAVNATSFGTAIYPAGTYTFVDPGAPREYSIGIKWEFE